jgi:alpha-ketoglutarate-dependent taurine dioxygenase
MISVHTLASDQPLPQIIEAERGTLADLIDWLDQHQEQVDAWILAHGAVLFRGFAIHDDKSFVELCKRFTDELGLYVEGNSPRRHTSEFVYTSTDYPAEFDISMHNELSYAHTPPLRLLFYCQLPSITGGQTPIVDCRRVLERLGASLVDRFERHGVRYVQNLHGGSGMGRSWQETFETEDRDEVERYLGRGQVEVTWLAKGRLRTEQVRPAIRVHPLSGERVWFNQADQWHVSNLDAQSRRALERFVPVDQFPLNATFGDGSPIPQQDLDHIRSTLWSSAVRFDWRRGDVLVVDNYLVAHGRHAYTGARSVRVAMGGAPDRLARGRV